MGQESKVIVPKGKVVGGGGVGLPTINYPNKGHLT